MSHDVENFFGKVIYGYTRAQALEDGVLVDVSEPALKAGFKIPVAVTNAVWVQYIEWTDEDNQKQTIQVQTSRLWNILLMLMRAIKIDLSKADQLLYPLAVVPRDGKSRSAKAIKLKSVIGGGDNLEPVITIMLPTED